MSRATSTRFCSLTVTPQMQCLLILSLLLAHADALHLGQPLASRRRLAAPRACAKQMEPTPELGPAEVCKVVCAGLKHINDPFPDAGITRLYNWMTAQGRVSLAPPPPKSGLQGGVTLEYFLEEAAGPAIGTFMECARQLIQPRPRHPPSARPHAVPHRQRCGGICLRRCIHPPPLRSHRHPRTSRCTRFGLVGEPTVMAGTPTRGGLATQLIEAPPLAPPSASCLRPSFRPPPSASHLLPPTLCLHPASHLGLSRYGALGAPIPPPPPPRPAAAAAAAVPLCSQAHGKQVHHPNRPLTAPLLPP